MGKKLFITATKTGVDPAKTASRKIVHKTAKAIGELRRNKITEDIVKPKPVPDADRRNIENIFTLPEKI